MTAAKNSSSESSFSKACHSERILCAQYMKYFICSYFEGLRFNAHELGEEKTWKYNWKQPSTLVTESSKIPCQCSVCKISLFDEVKFSVHNWLLCNDMNANIAILYESQSTTHTQTKIISFNLHWLHGTYCTTQIICMG